MTEKQKIKIIFDTWNYTDLSLWDKDWPLFRAMPKRPLSAIFYTPRITNVVPKPDFDDVVEFRKFDYRYDENTIIYGVEGSYKGCTQIVEEQPVYRKRGY
jgi:hypothetical protein